MPQVRQSLRQRSRWYLAGREDGKSAARIGVERDQLDELAFEHCQDWSEGFYEGYE